MLYLVIFNIISLTVGIASAGITIYKFIENRQSSRGLFANSLQSVAVFGTVAIVMLLLTVLTATILPPQLTNPISTYPAATPTATPITALTSIPTTTPTPTPIILPGKVLYQENGSDNWAGWAISGGWKVLNGLLISTIIDGKPSAVAPYSGERVGNFAVEAVIAAPEGINQQGTGFGITACGSTQGNWQGYSGGIAPGFLNPNGYIDRMAAVDRTNDPLATTRLDPGTVFHQYRLEIRENVLTLRIDGTLVVSATDQSYLPCGPQVGLWNSIANVLQVKSFTVIAL